MFPVSQQTALNLRGRHPNKEATESQAAYWSWLAFYLQSDPGINATAARLSQAPEIIK
jgi:hypothetical protein